MTTPESNDRDGPVRPPVIDIEAEDVTPATPPDSHKPDEPESPAGPVPPPPPPPPSPRRKSHHWRSWGLLLLLVAAAALGAWAYKDYGQRFWPSDEMTALADRVAALEAGNKTLNDQLLALGGSIDTLKSGEAAQSDALAAAVERGRQAESEIAGLKEGIASTEARFAETQTAISELRSGLDALKASIAAAGENLTITGPDPAALAALAQRVDALDEALQTLRSEIGRTEQGADQAALLSQTLADLKAKFATGAPYQDELNTISRLVPAAPGVAQLAPDAASGLPDAQGLAAALQQIIPDLPAPANDADAKTGNDYWDYLVDLFGSVVTIRVVGETNWRDVAERARAYAETSDLPAAISLIGRAEGEPPAALAAWRNKAQARLDGEAALDDLSAAVLRELAAKGSTP
ncbi:MAG: hypothetical protein JNM20_14275 [Rhizobiales bacterium]|nr:hypothetical protein [Hyphomicrobiales bacterium]